MNLWFSKMKSNHENYIERDKMDRGSNKSSLTIDSSMSSFLLKFEITISSGVFVYVI